MRTKGRRLFRRSVGLMSGVLLMSSLCETTAMASSIGLNEDHELINVYANAAEDAEVTGQITKGNQVMILEEKDGWIRIQLGSVEGWVDEDLTIIDIPDIAEQTEETANPSEEPVNMTTGSDITAEDTANETINETANETVNETVNETANETVNETEESAEMEADVAEEAADQETTADPGAMTEITMQAVIREPEEALKEMEEQKAAAAVIKAAETEAVRAANEAAAQAALAESRKLAEEAAREAREAAARAAAEYSAQQQAIAAQQEALAVQAQLAAAQQALVEQAQLAAEQQALAVQAQQMAQMNVTDSDVELLAAIIHCEAGGEPYVGQVAVAEVVINRVQSSRFQNSISDVIYAKGQFTPAGNGKLGRVLNSGSAYESCRQAAREALAGSDYVGDALFFRRAGGKSGQIIGNHVFY